MKTEETRLYGSAEGYFRGPDGMKNEVAMWYTAGAMLIQQLFIKNGKAPFGGLGSPSEKKEKSNPGEVLDVCSGPGNFVHHLQIFSTNISPTCVDHNRDFITAGKRLFPDWEWIEGDVILMNLRRKFPIITASSAYHHIPDQDKRVFLENMRQHITDDGFVLVCENFLPSYSTSRERMESIHQYYNQLIDSYERGNATSESIEAIREVFELEKSGTEEHKVSFEIFCQDIRDLFTVFQDIVVWQTETLRADNAGSHVLVLYPK